MVYICNAIEIPIIRLFSVSSHGKGEVGHVGGLAKVAIIRYIGTGGVVLDAGACADFLENKFGQNTNPKFYVKEINADSLNSARHEAQYQTYTTIDGSSLFQVMVFKPQNTTFKAAAYICLCESCMKDYGSCSLFTSYQLLTGTLNEINLRFDVEPAFEISDGASSNNSEFLLPNRYCAVAADKVSTETV